MTDVLRKPGEGGSRLDALTGPLPVLAGCGVIGVLVAVEAAVAVAVVLGLLVWVGSAVPGLARVRQARRTARAEEIRWQARRAQLSGSRARHWQRMRHSADDSVERFERGMQRCRSGPLRARLAGIMADIEKARAEVHNLCEIGLDLEVELGQSQAEARQTLRDRRDEVEERVQAIDASLASAVGVALELALESLGAGGGARVDELVDELVLLRDSLTEVHALER